MSHQDRLYAALVISKRCGFGWIDQRDMSTATWNYYLEAAKKIKK
ncbi:MAG: hypothetical protein PHI02_06955 [Sulfurovaceae bacterium]|nr:hypothetical protein [Sulfurovaceae bacterium]